VKFSAVATAVAWSPTHDVLTIAAEEALFFMDPGLEPSPEDDSERPEKALLTFREKDKADEEEKPEGAKARAVQWKAVAEDNALYSVGCRITIPTDGDVQHLVWHHKGNYCAAVSPKAVTPSNQCIIHAVQPQKSMRPFSKMKGGAVQAVAFHPTKPHFVVATKTSVRIYDLQKQTQLKQLIGGAKWIGSLTVHPSGDHIVAGSYDRRLLWWDMDFGAKPYKTLQYHDRAIRRATFHPGKYPLLASSSDDGTISILHTKVFSDLMQGPQIVPVKRLREHAINQGFGVLDCAWHPTQPWLFTAGADNQAFLWA
jgi:ribosome biogenesis protein ERB1